MLNNHMSPLIGSTEDLNKYPKIHPIDNLSDQCIAIGDLHGNAMKGIYFLIRYGVMNLDATNYLRLWTIYNTPELNKPLLIEFQSILAGATFNAPKLITFIGDELADRGKNDWFTLLLMQQLSGKNVNYKIQLSNHSCVALQSFATGDQLKGLIGTHKENQQCSLDNMWALTSKQLITENEVRELANKYYKPRLSLIGYTKDTGNHITLYTHAPVGLETVRDLSEKFGVKYDNSTIDQLIACIDGINSKARLAIENNEFINYYNTTNPTNDNDDPVHRLLWARELRSDFTLEPVNGSFEVECVHGHIGEQTNLKMPGLINLDTNWGKSDHAHKGSCKVFVAPNKIELLLAASNKYIQHLKCISPDALTLSKIEILNKVIDALQEKPLDNNRLDKFKAVFTPANILILKTRRDNAAETFLKVIAVTIISIASLGFFAKSAYQRFFGDLATEGSNFISNKDQHLK